MHLDKYSIFLSTVKINEPQKTSNNKVTHWILFSLAEIQMNTHQLNSPSTEQTSCRFLTASGQQVTDNRRHAAQYATHIANCEMASLGNDAIK